MGSTQFKPFDFSKIQGGQVDQAKEEKKRLEKLLRFDSKRSMEDVCKTFEDIVKDFEFGILHVHDVTKTLESKGVTLGTSAKLYEICNPKVAKILLDAHFEVLSILPCRICIYEADGVTRIETIKPTELLHLMNSDDAKDLAKQIDDHLYHLMKASV